MPSPRPSLDPSPGGHSLWMERLAALALAF